MIRVIYQWSVPESSMDEFIRAWRVATNYIRQNVVGARGSLMLRNRSNPNELLTIARWNQYADWERFWKGESAAAMHALNEFGMRLSVNVFEEQEDFTQ